MTKFNSRHTLAVFLSTESVSDISEIVNAIFRWCLQHDGVNLIEYGESGLRIADVAYGQRALAVFLAEAAVGGICRKVLYDAVECRRHIVRTL